MSKKREEYPEHEKLQAVKKESQVIGEFLEWVTGGAEGSPNLTFCFYQEPTDEPMFENGGGSLFDGEELKLNLDYVEPGWTPAHQRIEQLLALYFGIDLEKIAEEKERMYKRLQEMNS
jgi:hypothetical protein